MQDWLVQRYGIVSVVFGAVGIGLILLSEIADADWARIFGALLITAGGLGIGAWYGLAEPRRWPLQSVIRQWRKWIAILASVVLSAPVVAALFATVTGALDADGRQANEATVLLGCAVAIVFSVAVLVALGLGIRSIDRAAREVRAPADGVDGLDG